LTEGAGVRPILPSIYLVHIGHLELQ
jgi:hypothetical protein